MGKQDGHARVSPPSRTADPMPFTQSHHHGCPHQISTPLRMHAWANTALQDIPVCTTSPLLMCPTPLSTNCFQSPKTTKGKTLAVNAGTDALTLHSAVTDKGSAETEGQLLPSLAAPQRFDPGSLASASLMVSACICTTTNGYIVMPSSMSQNTSPRIFCTASSM
jgi:hypothetical protein